MAKTGAEEQGRSGGDHPDWCLEGYVDPQKRIWRTMIHTLPVIIGRHPRADLQLLSDKMSNRHAEITWGDEKPHGFAWAQGFGFGRLAEPGDLPQSGE